MLAACGAPTAKPESALQLKSCWVFERNATQDEEVEKTIREFGQKIGAPVLGTGIQVEVRFKETGYYVIYSRYIPAYGRRVQTFWSDERKEFPYNRWDDELRSSLSSFSPLSPCVDDYEAWISGE